MMCEGPFWKFVIPVLGYHILEEFPIIICNVIEESKGLCPSQVKFIIFRLGLDFCSIIVVSFVVMYYQLEASTLARNSSKVRSMLTCRVV